MIIRVISKSDEHAARVSIWNHKYDFGPKLHDTKFSYHYYSHFEIAEFSQYQYFIDQVAGLLKSGHKKAVTSHFVFETEMI